MATIPTVSWSEVTPAGSDNIALGDNRIRELKTQIREVINVDHDFPSSGQDTDVGQHKQVTLQEQADLGTGAVNATILGSQTVSGKGELVYTDEDDNDVQITSGGYLLGDSLVDGSNDFQSTALKTAILDLVYPIGSIYISVASTNPGTFIGGTWAAFGAGKTLIGLNSGDTDFDTAEETGGAKTATLTTDELPAHTHNVTVNSYWGSSNAGNKGWCGDDQTTGSQTNATTSTGSGDAFSIMNPYIVTYMFKRTA